MASASSRRRPRISLSVFSLFMCTKLTMGFLQQAPTASSVVSSVYVGKSTATTGIHAFRSPQTALNVWWFGGTEQDEASNNDDSCELVAVRIEKTSMNSRRIAGDISVPAKLEDVWSILTDYDRLSIHVPNLMESKIKQRNSRGEPGDGSFQCRLFQKGAQKIIGFDFSASVTMDMTEKISTAVNMASADGVSVPEERVIAFKCVESQFFSEFDGEWKVKEQMGPDGEIETLCSYVVDVRPKGPVPVAALEWRIREDVPTNLRAVKKATLKMGQPFTVPINNPRSASQSYRQTMAMLPKVRSQQMESLSPAMMDCDWDRDETMAKYL